MEKVMEGKEITDLKTLSKVKSVEEMLPTPATNQLSSNAPKIGEEQYNIIESCLKLDCTIEDACMYAWISVPSYYKHREKNPDFAIRMDRARQFPKMMARAAVQKRIAQWDSRTALEYLKLRDKRYKENAIEEWDIDTKTKVEFTIVKTINEWVDQPTNDSQTPTSASSAYDSYANSWENTETTPRENSEQVLKNLSSSNFSNE